jgi:hypothetical protein
MHSNNKEYFNDQSITIQQQMTSQQKNEQRVAAEAMRLREQKQLIDSQKIASAEEKKRQDEERARQAEEAKRLEIKRQEDQQRNVEEQKLAEQQRADAERKRLEVQRTTAEEAKRQETKRQEEELAKMAEFQNNQIMPTLYRILKNPTTESKAAIDLFEKVKELEQGKNKDKIKEAIDGLISQGAHLNQALIFAIAEVVAPINQLRIAAEQSQSLQAFSEAVGKLSTSKFKDNIVNFILKEYKNKIKLGESDRIFNHTPLYIVGTFLAGNAMMLGSTKAQLGLASMLGAKKEIKELEKSSEQIKNRLYAYEKIALNLIANDAPKADFLSAIDDFAKSIDYAMGRQARMFKMQIGFDSIMDGIKGIAQGKKLPRN